jgi:hypothetical protein
MTDFDIIDGAEAILRSNDCRITSFLASGQTQLVIKRNKMSVSPSFLSIRELCEWVVTHREDLKQWQ